MLFSLKCSLDFVLLHHLTSEDFHGHVINGLLSMIKRNVRQTDTFAKSALFLRNKLQIWNYKFRVKTGYNLLMSAVRLLSLSSVSVFLSSCSLLVYFIYFYSNNILNLLLLNKNKWNSNTVKTVFKVDFDNGKQGDWTACSFSLCADWRNEI